MKLRDILIGPIARNLARIAGGALVGAGLATPEMADLITADLAIVLGAGLVAIAEGVYSLAKRKGWAT